MTRARGRSIKIEAPQALRRWGLSTVRFSRLVDMESVHSDQHLVKPANQIANLAKPCGHSLRRCELWVFRCPTLKKAETKVRATRPPATRDRHITSPERCKPNHPRQQ